MKKFLLLFLVAAFSFACTSVEDQAKEKCEAIIKELDNGNVLKAEKLALDFDEWYQDLNSKEQAKVDDVLAEYADEIADIFGSYMEDALDMLEDLEYYDEEDWW